MTKKNVNFIFIFSRMPFQNISIKGPTKSNSKKIGSKSFKKQLCSNTNN